MGLLTQALVVFVLSFGLCAWMLGRLVLSTSEVGILRDQLLSSKEKAALEEQQEAIAKAAAPPVRLVPPTAEAPAAGQEDASAPSGKKNKEKKVGKSRGASSDDAPDQADQSDESEDGEADDETEDEDVDESAEAFREAKVGILKFLEGSLATFMKDGFQLDAISKFGCHLFLAGAAEAIGRENELDQKEFIKILETSVSVLGSDAEVVRRFGEKYDEYLLEPSYARMFKAGGDAMGKFVAGEGDAGRDLSEALELFRNPGDKTTDGPVAVMFTDIVGSTKLNQTLGDAEAQNVVRMHNTVVRTALKEHRGTEIKHTGDGIMASFASCPNAVEGAVAMQKDLSKRRKKDPKLPLHIRIGINAGEPIAEDGDLFGTTVQLAARICDKAEDDQIFVSAVVRELSAGSNVKFESKGTFELKGVEEPPTLYGVTLGD